MPYHPRNEPMNIGVIGYYGFGNAGDDVILENLRCILAPHRTIPLSVGLLHGPDTVRRLNAFDYLVLGGGGLFRDAPPSPFGTFDEWGDALQTPLGVLGLGVTRLDDRYVKATQKLVEHSTFFVVRDEESRRLIGHSKVQVAADLTFYRPFRSPVDRPATEERVVGVNLRPAHTGIDEWTKVIRTLGERTRAIPLSAHPALGDRDALLPVDPTCPEHFSIDMYAGLDLMIGTAFHSLIFAIQTGTPVVAINYDPKVYRLMHEAGLGDYLLEWDSWNELAGCMARVRANRDVICRRMADYTAQAEQTVRAALETPRRLIDSYVVRTVHTPAPIPTPTVSIIINGVMATASDVARTIASCRGQTHDTVEIILVTDRHEQPTGQSVVPDDARVCEVRLADTRTDWVSAGLTEATGSYVSWLHAGAWYAEDAIALLVDTLELTPNATVAHSCYFLTRDGIIERKVRLDSAKTPGRAVRLGPGLLVRRNAACDIWTQLERGDAAGVLGHARYVKSALCFTPATVAESRLYRSLVAYSRGEIEAGNKTLQMLQNEHAGLSVHTHEIVDLIAAISGNTLIARDPFDFVDLFFDNVPKGADDLLPPKRHVLAQLLMKRFYETRVAPGAAMDTLRTAVRAVRHDPAWLRNRGVWVRALQTLPMAIGEATRSAYRVIAQWARKTDYV